MDAQYVKSISLLVSFSMRICFDLLTFVQGADFPGSLRMPEQS
jgi:hypothetical protein